jgi:ethanolamine ammonia-lyase large subunit
MDVCYTNHAEADQDDMDSLMTLLAVAGVAFLIAVPGGDDIMLGYQSLAFHDLLGLRHLLNLRPAPEFDHWLETMGMLDGSRRLAPLRSDGAPIRRLLGAGALG